MSINSQDIARLRKSIENRMNWSAASSWHSKMFEELSQTIFKETGIMLSVATLKRFFGVVKHEGLPSVTTLDALSKFLGEENWTAFKTRRTRRKWPIKSPGKTTYITVGFILALVTVSLLSSRRPDVVINASDFEFSSKVLSNEFPNSVVFDFSIPEDILADTFKIQQYWDPTKTITVNRDQQKATGIYYHPGYFEAKLLADGQTIKTHDLFLKSNGWLGQIEYASTPKYFEPVIENESLSAPTEIANEVKSLEERTVTSFHYIDDLGEISGDNFQLSAVIKNTFDDRWAVCQATWIFVLATDGAFVIPFSKLGCSSDNNLLLNDVFLSGKSNDLSAFSADFSDPTSIQINVKEKQVSILIDNEVGYETSYSDTMGRLVGLRFKFAGLGEVISYDLVDQNLEQIQL